MNIEFLKSIGINDAEPNIVLSKLGAKEIELLDKRDLAETNGADDRVKEIDELLEKLKVEREQVKEDVKNHVPKKEDKPNAKQSSKEQVEKKKDAYEKLMQKKKAEAKAAQEEILTGAAKGSNQPQEKKTVSQKQSAQTNNNSSVQPQTQTPVTAKFSSSANGTGGYSSGLRYYQKKDYANAFKCFINVAEAKSVADQTAAQERIQASYLLAVMYREGLGTNKDVDRSNHYLKRAADFGYDQAQLEYGCLVLSKHMSTTDKDLQARKEGWKYIEMAADSGLVDAIKKYIDLAKNSSDVDNHVIDKAKAYIPLIKGQLDSYEASKCDDWVKELDDTQKAAKKKASYPKKFIIGEIIFLIGTIYLFKGLNPTFFEEVIPQVGKFIPDIPDILIIKWDKLLSMTDPYMTHQGIFGGWLIIIGNIIRGLGVKEVVPKYGQSKCKTFGMVIRIAIIALCVTHFIANIVETSHFLGNGSYMQFLAMIGCILIGRFIGMIMYKIIK